MEDVKIKFFDIDSCGYYEWGKSTPSFGDIVQTLNDLKEWAKDGKILENTKTYQADPTNDIFNTYFCECESTNGDSDYILVLWNEVKNDNGAIYGISPLNQPGQNSIVTSGFSGNKAIPGFPSYFWIIPSKSVAASITFEHSVQGKGNLERFINGYMRLKSKHRVFNDKKEIIDYSIDGKPQKNKSKTTPKFRLAATRSKDVENDILDNQSNIVRFIRKEALDYTVKDSRNVVEKAFSRLLTNTPAYSDSRTSTIEIPYKPTPTEIKEIIKNYDKIDDKDDIKNVGFQLKGGRRLMLKGIFVTEDLKLQIKRPPNQYAASKALLNEMLRHKPILLTKLP